jgi:hypothetical protein
MGCWNGTVLNAAHGMLPVFMEFMHVLLHRPVRGLLPRTTVLQLPSPNSVMHVTEVFSLVALSANYGICRSHFYTFCQFNTLTVPRRASVSHRHGLFVSRAICMPVICPLHDLITRPLHASELDE